MTLKDKARMGLRSGFRLHRILWTRGGRIRKSSVQHKLAIREIRASVRVPRRWAGSFSYRRPY